MTSPNLGPGDIGDFEEAANSGGISGLQGVDPSDYLQGQMGGMTGPVGAVGSAILGAVGGIVSDVVGYSEPGQQNLRQAQGFVLGKLSGATGGLLEPAVKPLAVLLAWILDGSPADWDTREEIEDNLVPALTRLPIRIIVDILGNVPVIGGIIEEDFSAWLRSTNASATAAAVTANHALALAQSANSGGVSYAETFAGSGALDSAKWTISASRVQRVSDDLGITTQTGDGEYKDWAVYIPQYESDDQSIGLVLGAHGSTSYATSLFLHCNADCTRFAYLNCFANKWYMGQGSRSGGSWTWNDWVQGDFDFDTGYSVVLQNVGNLWTATVNGTKLIDYPDTGVTAPAGVSYRHAGVKVDQRRLFFGNTRSHHIRAFAMADV